MPLTKEQRDFLQNFLHITNAPTKKQRKEDQKLTKEYEDYLRRKEKVEEAIQELQDIVGESAPSVTTLKKALPLAEGMVQKGQFKQAYDSLDKVKDAARKQRDTAAKAREKNHDTLQKECKSYGDRIAGLLKLDGAGDDPLVKTPIGQAQQILTDSRRLADSWEEATPDELAQGIVAVKGIEPLAKQAEVAAKDAKKRAKEDLDAIPRWNKLTGEAQKARDEIAKLPGAQAQHAAILTLIGESGALITPGPPPRGYKAAVDKLSGYEALLTAARRASHDLLARDLPEEVVAAAGKVAKALEAHAAVAPELATGVYRSQADGLRDLGRTDTQTAVTGLGELERTVQAETGQLVKDKDTAAQALNGLKVAVGELHTQIVPAQVEVIRDAVRQADREFESREWVRVQQQVASAQQSIDKALANAKQHGAEWARNESLLQKASQLGLELQQWKPLASMARALVDDAASIRQQFAKTMDYAACNKEVKDRKIAESLTALEDARDKGGVPRGEALTAFSQELAQVNNQVWEARGSVQTALRELEAQLEGLADRTATTLHTEAQQAWETWEKWFAAPDSGNPKDIARHRDPALKALSGVLARATQLTKDSDKLALFQREAQQEEQKRSGAKLPQEVDQLLGQLEALGYGMQKERKEYQAMLDPQIPRDMSQKGFASLRDDLLKKLDEHRRAEEKARAIARDAVDEGVLKPLRKTKLKGFENYQQRLESEAQDLKDLVDSGDPDLLQQAKQGLNDLMRRVQDATPEKYKDVEKLWTDLSHKLGKGNEVLEQLPDTYAVLYAQLQETVVLARRSSPQEGLDALNRLAGPIDDAVAKVKDRKEAKEAFKKRKKALEDKWSQVKKTTRTRVTDKTEAVAKYFEARLAEAETEAQREKGDSRRGDTLLAELDKMFDDILKDSDPRGKLQTLDGKFTQDQHTVEQLAGVFEAELKVFKSQTLPAARKAVERSEEGDTGMVDNLAKVADQAAKLVEKPSPILEQAVEQIQRARTMLADASRTAQRLTVSPETTNVNVSGDLKKVQDNWATQAQLYAKTARELAGAIRAAAKDETNKDVKAAAEKAAERVSRMAGHFRVDAFARPIAVLTKESTKETKERDQKARLAAREEALRTLRQMRQDLLKDPFLVSLTDRENPFLPPGTMLNAAGMLRAAMKRMELEALIGV